MDTRSRRTDTGEPDACSQARPVRRGAGGKGLANQHLACGLPNTNLREAVERLLDRHQQALQDIALPVRRRAPTTPDPVSAGRPRHPTPRSPGEQAIRHGRRAQRQARFAEVRALHADGLSVREVARRLGLNRATVTRYVRADAFPERANGPVRPGILAPYEAYLQQRWDAGCRSGLALLGEIRAQGYAGSRKPVARWVRERREAPAPTTPTKYRTDAAHPVAEETPPAARRPSARRLSWLLVRPIDQLSDEERAALAQMRTTSPAIATAYTLAQEFAAMVRERRAGAFAGWMDAARTSDVPDLQTFAAGLRRDESAVTAALTYDWSNGQTEGQVTKLKMVARQMFGRGKLDLLSRRVVDPF